MVWWNTASCESLVEKLVRMSVGGTLVHIGVQHRFLVKHQRSWCGQHGKYAAMTKAIRNETEAMVTITTIMVFCKTYAEGQDQLYLHYHDAQYTSVIKILSVV